MNGLGGSVEEIMRLGIDGELILRDLDRLETLTILVARRFTKMKNGAPVSSTVVANIIKARDAIKAAYEELDKQ